MALVLPGVAEREVGIAGVVIPGNVVLVTQHPVELRPVTVPSFVVKTSLRVMLELESNR